MEATSNQNLLRRVLGAVVFAARRPLSARDIRALFQSAEADGGEAAAWANLSEAEITAALDQLRIDCEAAALGVQLAQVAGGYRFQNDPVGGLWVRRLLGADRPARLSRPALETLAVIAYRQPVTRADIEAVRGVSVDHVIPVLMEMQLVRIVGRSDLPGRPMLYGTTTAFLEHFGLKDIKDLPGIEELARIELRRAQAAKPEAADPPDAAALPPQEEKEPQS